MGSALFEGTPSWTSKPRPAAACNPSFRPKASRRNPLRRWHRPERRLLEPEPEPLQLADERLPSDGVFALGTPHGRHAFGPTLGLVDPSTLVAAPFVIGAASPLLHAQVGAIEHVSGAPGVV